MAFGSLQATATSIGASISATNAISISYSASVGDLIACVMCEESALTASGASDNLGNTYTAQNAGTLQGGVMSGRMFYSRVTNGGSLTTINILATGAAHNFAAVAAAFTGPVDTNIVGANPANASDAVNPYNCPATGALTSTSSLLVSWGVASVTQAGQVWSASAPLTAVTQALQATNAFAIFGAQILSTTSSQTPVFIPVASADPGFAVEGTITFNGLTSTVSLMGQAIF